LEKEIEERRENYGCEKRCTQGLDETVKQERASSLHEVNCARQMMKSVYGRT
jgi:hypothetical protein